MSTGYISLWDCDCVFYEQTDCIVVISKDPSKKSCFSSHTDDEDFIIKYKDNLNADSVALIKRVSMDFDFSLKLFPQYILKGYHQEYFDSFEMTGEVIDDFFRPASFFYNAKENKTIASDYLCNCEIADEWNICFEEKSIRIVLSYGDILKWGIASDLKLHPKLTVIFDRTSDSQFIFRLYSSIIRFFQIVRYETKCGDIKTHLYCDTQKGKMHNGRLFDFSIDHSLFRVGLHEVEYVYYKPFMQRFFQFAFDFPDYSFYHYPINGIRYRGTHYSAVDYMNIFAAFEAECHANKEIYELTDTTRIQQIKDSLLTHISLFPTDGLEKEENDFFQEAKQRIKQIGTQYGQKKKIMNAYYVLQKALCSSIEYIFFLSDFRPTSDMCDDELEIIAKKLVNLRGSIMHGAFRGKISDLDAQKIRFLEILTYSQTLKRMGLSDTEIEIIIGIIFNCNFVLFNQKN